MSGFETLAQVYREIAYPKLKNLRITGNIVCVYAVICTGVITLFAGMIIPDEIRGAVRGQPAGRPRDALAGPPMLRLLFHVFVVVVGVLILSGAVNTSMIGANGVMNRVAEDGVLVDWFRKPHKRFGTTYRIINLIAMLQIVTIVAEPRRRVPARRSVRVRRRLEFLPEVAGRAGVALQPSRSGVQSSRLNLHIGGREMPVGLVADHADPVPGGDRQSVLEADRDHIRRRLHVVAVRGLHRFRARSTREERRTRKPGWKNSISTCGPEITANAVHARPGMRPGRGARLQPHGASAERAARRPICGGTTSW